MEVEWLVEVVEVLGEQVGIREGTEIFRLVAEELGAVVAAILSSHALMRERSISDLIQMTPSWLVALALALMLTTISISNGNDRSFIYFQF